jgi:hypothetical protein
MKIFFKFTILFILNLVSTQFMTAQIREYRANDMVEEMPVFENADPEISFSRYIQEQVQDNVFSGGYNSK